MNDNEFNEIEILDDFDELKEEINIIEEDENEKKLMETLNLAEILDPNIAVMKETEVETKSTKKEKNEQSGLMFIIILFGLLILFIFMLPYINKLLGK